MTGGLCPTSWKAPKNYMDLLSFWPMRHSFMVVGFFLAEMIDAQGDSGCALRKKGARWWIPHRSTSQPNVGSEKPQIQITCVWKWCTAPFLPSFNRETEDENQWILESPTFGPKWTSIAIKTASLTNLSINQKMSSKCHIYPFPIPWNTGFWRKPLPEQRFPSENGPWVKHLLISIKKLTDASEVDGL